MSQVILITGCSTGIGRDLAQRLTQAGYFVVATARKVEALEDLSAALKISLDVTQPDSVDQAVQQTVKTFGHIDVLVNNAGYAQLGVVEEIPIENVQQMFDVNVFGALRMIHAVAPYMRAQQAGRIINISSLAGKVSTPANGTYAATKWALEAFSNALRLELNPFGVQVIVIEPGLVRTHFNDTLQAHTRSTLSNFDSPYQALYQLNDEIWTLMQNQEAEPEVVSQVIQQAIESPNPKTCYRVNVPLPVKVGLYLGNPIMDLALRRVFKVDPSAMH